MSSTLVSNCNNGFISKIKKTDYDNDIINIKFLPQRISNKSPIALDFRRSPKVFQPRYTIYTIN